MENTYWNKKGPLQADYDQLIGLIGAYDKCDTVAGEMLRAANRLAYDFYNNGMGNNTSGAANYLLHTGAMDAETHSIIYPYTRGATYEGDYEGDKFQQAIESTITFVVELINANPSLTTKANDEDMYDFEEADEEWDDENYY